MTKKAEFREQFDSKLQEMFPECYTTGVVSRAQVDQVRAALGTKSYPVWHMENRVGRGLYAVQGAAPKSNAVKKEEAPVQLPQSKIVKNNEVPHTFHLMAVFGGKTLYFFFLKMGINFVKANKTATIYGEVSEVLQDF